MASLDTNCLLRVILNDVPEQAERVEVLLASGVSPVIDDVAWIETVFVLETTVLLSRPLIRDAVMALMSQPVTMNRELWTEVVDVWVEHPKLSVVDVYLAQRAKSQGYDPLYTFDKKLANQLDGVRPVPTA